MTLIAKLARRAPRRVVPDPQASLQTCSLCNGPGCFACDGRGDLVVTPPGMKGPPVYEALVLAQAKKPRGTVEPMLPVRPPGIDDVAFSALIELDWVAFAPATSEKHSQLTLEGI